MEHKPIRPRCFDFAMDFLGEPQASEIIKYIEALESNVVANSRLIAAAPDLLEALELLWREVVDSGNGYANDFGWRAAREKTLDAISKATGE